MANRKALIVGISGQDGSYLAKFLIGMGYDVIGTTRSNSNRSIPNLQLLKIGDRCTIFPMALDNAVVLSDFLCEIRPDEIYNLAGQSSVGASFDNPITAYESVSFCTLNLLEAVRLSGLPLKLFNASSSDCFGDTNGELATELSKFAPRSPYAVAKAAAFWSASMYRMAYGLFTCTGILFNHESPLRPDRFVTKKIVKAAVSIANGSNEKLKLGNISVYRDWGWAPEYVDAMWRILQQDQPDDFVIATGKSYSLENVLDVAFSKLGLTWLDHVELSENLRRPTDIEMSAANPLKAKQVLGWEATYKMPEVIAKMIDSEMEAISNYKF